MKTRSAILGTAFLLALLPGGGTATTEQARPGQEPVPTPSELWARFQKSLVPFTHRIVRDEIVESESIPGKMLRRIEFSFTSQTVPCRKDGGEQTEWVMRDLKHEGVIFIPTDPGVLNHPDRRGKVVIVGSLTGPWKQSFISNYGDPIASRTDYPTMILPNPGETDEFPGREYSQGLLIEYRKQHPDLVNHSHFRWVPPFLRGMDVMADVLGMESREIRAVIGGHSKRATSAITAAAVDPQRIAGVVLMGNESLHPEDASSPWWAVSPYYTQRFIKCPVLYIGATNENGYAMFNINRIQAKMAPPWTLEIIPNYRHASESEKQFLNWRMWVSHVFDNRPLTTISDLRHEETEEGTRFFARIKTPNTRILTRIWYVYCDDVPLWRDLTWYPSLLQRKEGDLYQGYVRGETPDAWLVEVLDTAQGTRGYVSSLPMNITGKPVEVRHGRGMPRAWKPKAGKKAP